MFENLMEKIKKKLVEKKGQKQIFVIAPLLY